MTDQDIQEEPNNTNEEVKKEKVPMASKIRRLPCGQQLGLDRKSRRATNTNNDNAYKRDGTKNGRYEAVCSSMTLPPSSRNATTQAGYKFFRKGGCWPGLFMRRRTTCMCALCRPSLMKVLVLRRRARWSTLECTGKYIFQLDRDLTESENERREHPAVTHKTRNTSREVLGNKNSGS